MQFDIPTFVTIILVPFLMVLLIVWLCMIKTPKETEIVHGELEDIEEDQVFTDSEESPHDVAFRELVDRTTSFVSEDAELKDLDSEDIIDDDSKKVSAFRGGEFVGNRLRFKVKVVNETRYTITDVTVYLLSYPRESLRLSEEDDDIFFSKIEPEGYRSPQFDFLPTQDCVKGEIVAGVSYVDELGKPHTLYAEPFVIRAVCDLLNPEKITPEDFALKFAEMECGELNVKVEEWTPEEMHDKTLIILDEANFHEVLSELDDTEGVTEGVVKGWARGKYTSKPLGVEITISGKTGKKGASCRIKVIGEDRAMILPAMDDIQERLSAWLCPMCTSGLSVDLVTRLRKGESVACPFCGVTLSR